MGSRERQIRLGPPMGMDEFRLSALSGLQKSRRRGRRVQWQVHDQSDGAARRIDRNARGPQSFNVQKFLPAPLKVAIYRNQTSYLMKESTTPERSQFATDVLEGLSATPKYLSSKYFYDDEGSRLFQEIMKLP